MPTHVITANNVSADPNTGNVAVVQTVYSLKTILTDAQIKALPTTYVELVPAPGTGKMLYFHSALLNFDPTGGAYTGITAGKTVTIAWGEYDGDASAQADILTWELQILTEVGIGTSWLGNVVVDNKPLKLCSNNPTDLTGGNAANSLEVTVFYSIVDL